MIITATQLKNRLGHYLKLAKRSGIIVTERGEPIAKVVGISRQRDEASFAMRAESGSATKLGKIQGITLPEGLTSAELLSQDRDER